MSVDDQLRRASNRMHEDLADVAVPVLPDPEGRGWRPVAMAIVLVAGAIVGVWVVGPGSNELPVAESTAPPVETTVTTTATSEVTTPANTEVTPPATSVAWSVELFTSADGLPEGGISQVTVGSDGTVWAILQAGQQRSLFRLDDQAWNPVGPVLAGPDLEWMVPTPQGGVLVATSGCFLALFDGDEWHRFTEVDGIPPLGRCTAMVGIDGTPWVFGYNQDQAPVLIHADGTALVVDSVGPIPSSFPSAELRATFDIAADGIVWYGTSEGAWSFDGTDLISHPLQAQEGCCPATLAVDAENQVWVQHGADVHRFAGGQWTHYTSADGRPAMGVGFSTIVPTADGSVWFLGASSVVLSRDGSWTTFTEAEARAGNIPSGFPVAVDSPDGTTWVLAGSGGLWLHRFVDDHWEGGRLDTLEWEDSPDGSSHPVNWENWFDLWDRPLVVAPDGSVWMTTSDGVARISPLD